MKISPVLTTVMCIVYLCAAVYAFDCDSDCNDYGILSRSACYMAKETDCAWRAARINEIGDRIAEAGDRVAEGFQTAIEDCEKAYLQARDDVDRELKNLEKSVRKEVKQNVDKARTGINNVIAAARDKGVDELKTMITSAVLAVVPGGKFAQAAALSAALAEASAHGVEVINHVNLFIDRASNRDKLFNLVASGEAVTRLDRLSSHADDMLSPFLSGPFAVLLNCESVVRPIKKQVDETIHMIREGLSRIHEASEEVADVRERARGAFFDLVENQARRITEKATEDLVAGIALRALL